MIKLSFFINREVFRIIISEKEVWYVDRKWEKYKGIRLLPENSDMKRQILMSRNKLPHFLINIFDSEKDRKRYFRR